MNVKIKLDGASLVEIARIVGAAPCQILALNNVRTETELKELTHITVPTNTCKLISLPAQ